MVQMYKIPRAPLGQNSLTTARQKLDDFDGRNELSQKKYILTLFL